MNLQVRRFPSLVLITLAAGFASAVGCSSDDVVNPSNPVDAADAGADATWDASLARDAQNVPIDANADVNPEDARGIADAKIVDTGTDSPVFVDANTDPAFAIYDPAVVPTFELTLDAAALAILSDPSDAPADQKKWAHGTFKYGAVVVNDVGVRRKGSSTFRALPQKAAFKIRFDKYVPNQRLLGLAELTLNNSMSDPTFVAERLAYHVFRSVGVSAQRANSAQVTINGAPYGVYLNVETPNLDFITRVFGADAKSLYEVNHGSQWLPGVEDGFEEEVGDGTKGDVTALLQSVQDADDASLLGDVSGHLDTIAWLTFAAAEAATGHYDGYGFGFWGSHNYFMAGNQQGVFSLVPWSTDLTFSDRQTVVQANEPATTAGGQLTLLGRCKLSAACWTVYRNQVGAVLTAFEGLDLVNLAKAWHGQIDALVRSDTKREAPIAYYESETTRLYPWIAARPGIVRGQLGLAP